MGHFQSVRNNDSKLWQCIFQDTGIPSEIKARLRYIHTVGARLVPDSRFGYRIQPIIGTNGWESQEQYDQEKVCLIECQATVAHILKKLSEVANR